MTEWQPVRPFGEWPVINASPADTRESIVIPDGSVDTAKVSELSVTKLTGIGIKVYLSAAVQEITAGATGEDITFDAVAFNEGFTDPGSSFSSVAVPYAGVYAISAAVQWENDSVGARNVFIEINGTEVEGDRRSADNTSRSTLACFRNLAAGDTVGLHVEHDSTTDPLDVTNGEDNCSLSVVFLFAI